MTIKIKTPKDVTALCETIAKGHERRKKDYESRRIDIIYHGTSAGSSDFTVKTKGSVTSDPVVRKAESLEKLENSLDYKFIKAVEQSLSSVGAGIPRDLRDRLRSAVLLNCENGRDYPYEILNIDEFSKRDFYRRRKQFLNGIGVYLGIIDE